ncbi:CsbD family protein [Gloeocapsa sp. PCC 73106]|uniref:CsbD family protein n=1 Tax=Gloeocapsa sp. PCC 73106 TaxID=102232 RepID=UPI0002AC1A4B|nr:CsbD family protein [Gloeocapsa sp. PCC 73106]ELR98508.1 hypothetical protein GLO73106DRAFT_00023410 [Gloeocapsa sp. PCC 73106]
MKLSRLLLTAMCIVTVSFSSLTLPSMASVINPVNSLTQEYHLLGFFDNLFNKTEATSKKVEGQIQEKTGELTDNPQDQIVGKAKQAQGETTDMVGDIKKAITDATEEASKNLEELGTKATQAMENLQK